MQGVLAKISKEQCSMSGDAVLMTDYASDFTTRGSSFLLEKNIVIPSGGSIFLLWDYTTYKPTPLQSGQVFIFPPLLQASAGPVTCTLYRESNYAGGTPLPAMNPNINAPKRFSGTTITLGATGTNKGEPSMEYLVGGDSQGSNSAAGSTRGLSFFVSSNTRKALLEVVNGAGKDITFHIGQTLYEI